MSCTKRFLLLPGALFFASAAMAAVDPRVVFEVGDGNTTTGDTAANCDWNTLNSGKTDNSNTPSAICAGDGGAFVAYGFLVGAPGEKNFTGGGSKDPIDITSWKWSVGSTPDKDTLTHGYAASYTVSGDKILTFGAERFAINGDANIGIWFFQQQVSPNASGGFDGVHVPGDVFAVSAFTNGGAHPGLDVYSWDPTCSASNYKVTLPLPSNGSGECAATNLRLRFSGATGSSDLCTGGPGCTSVNTASITLGWPYESKFGSASNSVPPPGFFEGGLDLTAIFPNAPGCFSSFLVETRSSQSPSAVLKDFLSGSFPECHMSLTKACACASADPAQKSYTYDAGGLVINDGGGPIYNVTVSDPSITGSYSCGTLAKGQTKVWGAGAGAGDCTGSPTSFTSTSTAPTNYATAHGTSAPSASSSPVDADSRNPNGVTTCSFDTTLCTFNPKISVTKNCVTGLQVLGSNVVVRVDYTGLVTNTGLDNLNSVSVQDTTPAEAAKTFTIGTLTPNQAACYTTYAANNLAAIPGPNPSATCPNLGTVAGPVPVNGSASYFPATFVNLGNGTSGRAGFTDHVHATGTDPYGVTVNADADAPQCVVCPLGVCPTQ